MLGKLIKIYVGRSIARKHGFSPLAGAAAGLIVPTLIKGIGSAALKRRAAAREAKRERQSPKYLRRIR